MSENKFKLYHNQRCRKSRGVQALLDAQGVEYSVVDYLQNPPEPEHLMALAEKAGIAMLDLVRFGEAKAAELGLSAGDAREDRQWAELLSNNPQLLQRPILETEDDAVIGRPPERILVLLE